MIPRKPQKQHWIVRMHYAMRTLAFALLFIASSLHLLDKNFGVGGFFMLALVFIIYPHLQYLRTSRSTDPVATELNNLLIDNALLGATCAALQFPLWITFSAATGSLVNSAFNEGWRGATKSIAIFSLSALFWALATGAQISPNNDWPVTLFCICGLTLYLFCMGNIAFTRNRQLRTTREQLRASEQAMLEANESLRQQLAEIDLLQDKLRDQANRDPLTGLYNRRYLDTTLERELSRCKREGLPLALMMIDLDHFKNVNDTYGHQAGDEILKMMGDILKGFARAEDVACRYGGEEFLLLLPKMSLDTALERAESLRQNFSSSALAFGEFRLNTTLSVGVAIYPGHGKSADELLQSADRSLYAAKRSGRNRVEVESMVPLSPPEGEPGSVIRLLWQDQFLTGNAEIDAQHRTLFVSANALLDAVASRQPAEQLRTLTDALLQEVIDHFRLEEALLEHATPSTAPHLESHQELLDRAAALIEKSRGGTIGLGELLQFLAEDLVSTHICQMDVPAFTPTAVAAD